MPTATSTWRWARVRGRTSTCGSARGPGPSARTLLPGLAAIGAPGDARAGEMVSTPGAGPFLRRRHEHELGPPGMENQEIGIAADLVSEVGPLLPRLAAVAAHVHPDTGRDVDAIGIQRIDQRAVHVVVHPRDHPEGLSGVGALQEAALLHTDEQRVGVVRMEVDVLG